MKTPKSTYASSFLLGAFLFSAGAFADADPKTELEQISKPESRVTLRTLDGFAGHAVIVDDHLIRTEAVEKKLGSRCLGENLFAYPLGKVDGERAEIPLATLPCIESVHPVGNAILVKAIADGKPVWYTLKNFTDANQTPERYLPELLGPNLVAHSRALGETIKANRKADVFEYLAEPSAKSLTVLSTQFETGKRPLNIFDIFSLNGVPELRQALAIADEAGLPATGLLPLPEDHWIISYSGAQPQNGRLVRYALDRDQKTLTKQTHYGSDTPMSGDWKVATEVQFSTVKPRLLTETPSGGFIGAEQSEWSWDQTPGKERAGVFYYSTADNQFHPLKYLKAAAEYLVSVQIYKEGVLYVENEKILWVGNKSPFPEDFEAENWMWGHSKIKREW